MWLHVIPGMQQKPYLCFRFSAISNVCTCSASQADNVALPAFAHGTPLLLSAATVWHALSLQYNTTLWKFIITYSHKNKNMQDTEVAL